MVKIIYNQAKYKGEIKLSQEVLHYFEKNNVKSVALFASIQFLDLDKIKEQLKQKEIKVLLTKAKRTKEEGQIIGCNIYKDNFEKEVIEQADIILYIGDGMFHPTALLFAQAGKNIKPIIIYNPISQNMEIIDKNKISEKLDKIKVNVKKFISSDVVGILVSVKPGQQHLLLGKKLKEKLEKQGKSAYVFLEDKFDLENLENFNFIECWVNTACPRIGIDDAVNFSKPIINVCDALNPIETLERLE